MASDASAVGDAPFCRRESVSSCPVCRSDRRRELFETGDWVHALPGRFLLVSCTDCGLGYLADRPIDEDLGLYYPEGAYYAYREPAPYALFRRRDPAARAWYFIKRSELAHGLGYRHLGGSRWLAALVRWTGPRALRRKAAFDLGVLLHPWTAGGALLEVGCGSGMYLGLMQALGWARVVGVDTSPLAVTRARDILGIEVYCGELSSIGFAADSFDAVTLSHTLEHVPHVLAFLAEVQRVMKPGGRLAVVVPNLESLCARRFGPFWSSLEAPRHLLHFTRASLRLALERADLRVESLSTTPRAAYVTALFSAGRRAGDPPSVAPDPAGYALHRRAAALATALHERLEHAIGRPMGEELLAVARKPS